MPELTGRELDAAVAVAVFGWRWFLDPQRGLVGLFPPERDGWERFNFPPDAVDVTGREAEYERFSDWHRRCGKRGGRNDYLLQLGLPSYSSDIGAAWQIVEHQHAQGDCLSLVYRIGDRQPVDRLGWFAHFRLANAWAVADTPAESICRAALESAAGTAAPKPPC